MKFRVAFKAGFLEGGVRTSDKNLQSFFECG